MKNTFLILENQKLSYFFKTFLFLVGLAHNKFTIFGKQCVSLFPLSSFLPTSICKSNAHICYARSGMTDVSPSLIARAQETLSTQLPFIHKERKKKNGLHLNIWFVHSYWEKSRSWWIHEPMSRNFVLKIWVTAVILL